MTVAVWLPIFSLGISLFTFVAGQREVSRRAKVDYVAELEHRIEECEADRTRLQRDVHDMREEHLDLMRRMFRLEDK